MKNTEKWLCLSILYHKHKSEKYKEEDGERKEKEECWDI
jgi:hypothetical protein